MAKPDKQKIPASEMNARKQALLLWAILAEGGGNDVSRPALESKGMLTKDEKAARDALRARGLITVDQRSSRNDKGKSTRSIWMSVTDNGRTWAEENLASALPDTKAAAPILQAWLRRLSVYLSSHSVPLASVLGLQGGATSDEKDKRDVAPEPAPTPSPSPPPPAPAADYAALRARIRQAYLDLTGGRLNTRALLADIRAKLADVDRATLDEALKQMQREEEASLYQLDNKAELTEADRAAAIYFGADPRHILWIER